jgi:uncharacterized membrane protein YfcA
LEGEKMIGRQPWVTGVALLVGVFLGTLFGPLFAQKKEATEPKANAPTVGRYQLIAAKTTASGIDTIGVMDTTTGKCWEWFRSGHGNWESVIPAIPTQE